MGSACTRSRQVWRYRLRKVEQAIRITTVCPINFYVNIVTNGAIQFEVRSHYGMSKANSNEIISGISRGNSQTTDNPNRTVTGMRLPDDHLWEQTVWTLAGLTNEHRHSFDAAHSDEE